MSQAHQWTPEEPSGPPPKSGSNVLIIVLIVCGVLVLLCAGGIAFVFFMGLPKMREAAQRSACKNNLKQISLALHNYHETYGTLPPAYIPDENGKPMHSWRVLILPYLEQKPLYDRYKWDEPWDGPNNRKLADRMPTVYRCPGAETGSPMTHYMTVRGDDTAFPGAKSIRLRAITDSTATTIAVVETPGNTVHWMSPDDVSPEEFIKRLTDADSGEHHHPGGSHAAMADGTIHFLSSSISVETLKALFTRAGNETVGDF